MVSDTELLQCAGKVATLTTAEFSEQKAELVLDTASNGSFSEDTLIKLTKIR